jgi:hypothetical protein
MMRGLVLCAIVWAVVGQSHGQTLMLSVSDDTGTELGGLTFSDGDVVDYAAGPDTATLLFSEANISPDADVDAFHRFDDGSILISTLLSGRTLGGLTFNDGDLVRYFPNTNSASIYFISEASFASTADISAVSVDSAGNIVLSTLAGNTLGGLTYTDGDLIQYDPDTGTAVLLVAEATLFDDGDGNITGVHVLEDGSYLLSFASATESISGTVYNDGDVVRYDPVADTASLYFSEALFTDGVNSHAVDAIFEAPAGPSAAAGFTLFLSDNLNVGNMLGGLTYTDGDIARYDVDSDTATLFFAETSITPSADIDAYHLFSDGSFLLSVLFNGRTLGGLTFSDADLVRYDPATDTASIYFISESTFATSADINAVSVDSAGRILLSVREPSATIGALTFTDGDLVAYDTDTGTASVVIAEADLFDDGDGDISSVHALPDGTFLLSFVDATELISGLQFNDGDVFLYDPVADSATLIFSETQFTDGSTSHEIDAVYLAPAGDCEADGDVDLADYVAVGQGCLSGPAAAPPANCGCFDLDRDGDVDLVDYALYLLALTD